VFHVGKDGQGLSEISRGRAHQVILLDSLWEDGNGQSGGTGKVLDRRNRVWQFWQNKGCHFPSPWWFSSFFLTN